MARLTARARQALAQDRKAQILASAEDVFASRGYHGATIHEIAERAGLADGTIYLYFPSKRALLLAAWETVAMSTLVPLLGHAADGSGDEAFMAALLADRFEMIRRHAVFLRLVLHQADLDKVFQRSLRARMQMIRTIVADWLRQRIAEGALRPVAVSIVVRAIAGMMVGIALMDAYDPEPLHRHAPAEAVAREVARLLLYGLQAPALDTVLAETGADVR